MADHHDDILIRDLEELTGATLAGRFRLERMLGQGGYGAVFEAEQTSVGRRCAVKVLVPHVAADPRNTQRFKREAKLTSQLAHPNTVVIYDFGLDDERRLLFLAMEFLEGESLRDRIHNAGTLDISTAVWMTHQAARSLQDAHERGLVHRDVKPHNVMVISRGGDPNFVKVIDFGIAKFLHDESVRESMPNVTATGMVIGTPAYMSPEAVRNKALDGRTDQYSLAVCVYQMLTGRTVFLGESAVDIATKQLIERPLPLRALNPTLDVSNQFEDVLLRALSKKADDRFESIREFADALAEAAGVALPRGIDTGEQRRQTSSVAPALPDVSTTATTDGIVDPTGPTEAHSFHEASTQSDVPELPGAATTEVSSLEANHTPPPAAKHPDVEQPALVGEAAVAQGRPDEPSPDDRPGHTLQVPARQQAMPLPVGADSQGSVDEQLDRRRAPAPMVVGSIAIVLVLLLGGVVMSFVWPGEGGESEASLESHLAVIDREPVEHDRRAETPGATPPSAAVERPDPTLRANGTAQVEEEPALDAGPTQENAGFEPEEAIPEIAEPAGTESAERGREREQAATGTVTVTLVPWGTLYVDGRKQGDSGRQRLRLSVGEHRLELRQNGDTRARTTVDVQAGRHRMVELIAH